jgi:carbamoyltransferase
MYVLGISCFYHDKHDASFPQHAIHYVLRAGGIDVDQLDYVGFYDKPFVKFERIVSTYLSTFPKSYRSFSKAIPLWLGEKLWMRHNIKRDLSFKGEVLFIQHHQSHAASAFMVSPFQEAAVLTLDGVGEWATASYGNGKGNKLELFKEIRFPHSLGLLYSAFTYYLGFKVNSAEYKVMGAAPYGEPRYYDRIMSELIRLREDGSFKLNMKYFAYDYGLRMTNKRFDKLFEGAPREPETRLQQRHWDIAASVQKVTEEVVLRMGRHLHAVTGQENLCMAGGVALNCVANGRLLREGPFKRIFVQPAAGDAGGAVGVASFIYHQILGHERKWVWPHTYWGPEYSTEEVREYLETNDIKYHEFEREGLLERTSRLISDQNVVGWFQGRMEFGPRSLGNRSILADARNAENKDIVNLKIKFRESFRPFAPSVLAERCSEYFDLDAESPYMLLVAQVRSDKRVIPSVTHVDGSARIQTVSREQNPMFHDLISAFDRLTGCPVIINTSFNVRGEPIVCTPADAYLCFMRTNMDYLVLDRFLLDKREMRPLREDVDWRTQFDLD